MKRRMAVENIMCNILKYMLFSCKYFLCSDFRVILDFFLYGKYFPNKLFCHHLKVVLKFVVTLVVHSTLVESRTIHWHACRLVLNEVLGVLLMLLSATIPEKRTWWYHHPYLFSFSRIFWFLGVIGRYKRVVGLQEQVYAIFFLLCWAGY